MKKRGLFFFRVVICILCMSVSNALAVAGSSIMYVETDLGGGQWQYDYAFYNTSTAESLFSVFFYFARDTAFTGVSLPVGWEGVVWDGNTWTTGFADTFSTEKTFDISAGSSLRGFSFTVDYQAGNIAYDAFFSGDNVVPGVTVPVASEPASSLLFVTGGIFLGGGVYRRRKRSTIRRRSSDGAYPFL